MIKDPINWETLERFCNEPDPDVDPKDIVATVTLLDYLKHWDECGQPVNDDWKPDHQRIEEIAAAREGRKARKVT